MNKRRRFKAKRKRAEDRVVARLARTFHAVAMSFEPDPGATFSPAEIAHLRLLEAAGKLRIIGALVPEPVAA